MTMIFQANGDVVALAERVGGIRPERYLDHQAIAAAEAAARRWPLLIKFVAAEVAARPRGLAGAAFEAVTTGDSAVAASSSRAVVRT